MLQRSCRTGGGRRLPPPLSKEQSNLPTPSQSPNLQSMNPAEQAVKVTVKSGMPDRFGSSVGSQLILAKALVLW